MRPSWLIPVGPASSDKSPQKRRKARHRRPEKASGQRGSDGSDAARSQGVWSHQKLDETKHSLLAPLREHALRYLDFRSLGLCRDTCLSS